MTKSMKVLVTTIAILAAPACSDGSTGPTGPTFPDGAPGRGVEPAFPDAPRPDAYPTRDGPVLAIADRRAGSSGRGVTDVVSFADPTHVVGRSELDRGHARINVRLSAGEVQPGEATTLWAVVFNNPEACVGECDDPDLFENPAAAADLMYVAGAVADGRGVARFAAGIFEGDASASIMPLFGLPAPGVIDTDEAELHFVVRSHGPAIAGLRHEQTTTFNGGCTGLGSEFGIPGPNECVDLYFASHYAN